MKHILQRVIIYLIQLIETYEYRKVDTSGERPLQKIVDILFIEQRVESDYGKVEVTELVKTIPLARYELELENGIKLECADSHIVYCKGHTPKLVIDLSLEDYVITKEGLSRVKRVNKLRGKLSMYDLTIDGPEPSYYTNDILSHNTISAALVILHYVLFNNDKSVMIVANKGKTVVEIISKIKGIYKLLPFFLQSGIITWNEKSLTFENGCRIQTENRTKEPSIGFTIDFLYLDEFAKVPDNIVESYYGAIVPTVSSVNNSKIIITSTPDGYNLFHKLLIGAEKSPEDPDKNMYEAMRVYWYQVDGRRDVRLYPLSYKLKEYNIDRDDIYNYLDKRYSIYEQEFNNRLNILVKWDFDDERTYIHNIRGLRIKIDGRDVPLAELCIITNWQEEETKLIGGADMFNQEYDLKFITGDKMLFSSEQMEKFKKDSVEFKYIKIPELDNRLLLPYTNLKWLSGRPDIFDIRKVKDYYMVAAIDLGEGLAQDYSIINIFRLMPKSKELIEKSHETLNTLYDYFYIEQVGLFRSNDWSVDEVAEIFYVLFFEIFDSEKSKVVLEYNTYGGKFLSELIHVFDDQNDYSNGIFLRYKHKKDDKMAKIGMKITGGENDASKKLLVKQLQTAVRKQLIKINNSTNVNEITTFTKKVTPSGNFTYSASVGHDDIVMTNVDVSSVFSHVQYKNMVDDLYNQLSVEERNVIDKYLSGKRDDKVDYSGSMDARNRVYGNKGKSNPFTPQLGKSTRFRPNIPSRNTNPWNR
jgi:hypothetical protein